MSLLRNTDSDGSINFQKASCTLDGCVKIWTSRVDSTATAVGKLISGLAEEHSGLPPSNPRSSLRKLQTAAGDEEGDEGDGGGSDNEQSHQRKKRVCQTTLESSLD